MSHSVVAINQALCADAAAFIRQAEADYRAQLTEIADYIAAHRDTCPIVLLSGPSGSGKTTTARMLEAELDRRGLETHTLSQDNYFRTNTPEEMAMREQGLLDLESPARVDEVLLAQQLQSIIACETVELPVFDFRACECRPSGVHFTRKPGEIVILEGIHVLNPAVAPAREPDGASVRQRPLPRGGQGRRPAPPPLHPPAAAYAPRRGSARSLCRRHTGNVPKRGDGRTKIHYALQAPFHL